MNLAFAVLAILAAIALWFLLSFAFIPLGKLLYRIAKDASDAMKAEDEEN